MLRWSPKWFLWLSGAMLIQVVSLQVGEGLNETGHTTARDGMIVLTPVVSHGLESPVFLTHAGDGSSRGSASIRTALSMAASRL